MENTNKARIEARKKRINRHRVRVLTLVLAFLLLATVAGIGGAVTAKSTEKEAEDVKVLLISIELTEAQRLALERRARRTGNNSPWGAKDEAELLAHSAIAKAANEEMYITADEIKHEDPRKEREEAEAPVDVPDPIQDEAPTCLTPKGGVFEGPSGIETWYDLPMDGVVKIMRDAGFSEMHFPYWERSDGVKMLGPYVMAAANLETHPRGSLVGTSRGVAIVCDTGAFAESNPMQLDIATNWNTNKD